MSDARTILITGATRGLGRALVERYAAEGHTLVGCGTNEAKLAELRGALGPPHRFDRVDVTDDGAVERWIGEVVASVGVPDLVLNNAGVINDRAPVWKVSAVDFDRVIRINVLGVANVLRHVVPPMIARGSGVICNLSSGWGKFSAPEVGPYCASKFAIEGLTGSLAAELPAGVAAIALQPGIIHTEMLHSAFGVDAAQHWTPDEWIDVAAPFILALGPAENGQSVRIPDR